MTNERSRLPAMTPSPNDRSRFRIRTIDELILVTMGGVEHVLTEEDAAVLCHSLSEVLSCMEWDKLKHPTLSDKS